MDVATPEIVGFSPARLRRIDEVMHRLVDGGKIAGAVTLLARHGQIAHCGTYGQMDLVDGGPMRRDAIFRLASMTKPITAAAVMMLFEEGHFLLDDPIAGFIPEFARTRVFVRETDAGLEVADLERPITIRHLLTHTAGLTYDFWGTGPVHRLYQREGNFRADQPLEREVARLAARPLVFQPGSHWEYSVAIDVLGRLVEVVSGQPFDAFLHDRIFEPLEMSDTGYFVPPAQRARLAAVHTSAGAGSPEGTLRRDDAPAHDRTHPPTFLSGGGGLVSTAADYARFCQMLLNGGALGGRHLLGRKTVELLTANHLPDGTPPFPPGQPIGAGMSQALGGATVVNATLSGLPGSAGTYLWYGIFSNAFWIDPKEELAGIFLCQLLPPNWRSFDLFRVLAYQALDG
jgi:CubicO group peptidase (beta-lactamase class C family)